MNVKKKLRIGYIKDVGTFYPSKPVMNSIERAIETLKEDGHELIELDNSSLVV